ncbi:hypothetical protein Gain_0184_001 [Komagataeibacter intermedius TF2]|nr:hypothetical protein Gain_0184_001 [Komagataeibacter intermedius TF2]
MSRRTYNYLPDFSTNVLHLYEKGKRKVSVGLVGDGGNCHAGCPTACFLYRQNDDAGQMLAAFL